MAQYDQFVGREWYRSPPKGYAKTGLARSWTNGGADAKRGSLWCVRSCGVCATTLCCLQRQGRVCGIDSCLRQAILWQKPASTEHRGSTTCAYHWLHRSWVQTQMAASSRVVADGDRHGWRCWCCHGVRRSRSPCAEQVQHNKLSQRASSGGPIVAAGPLCRRAA